MATVIHQWIEQCHAGTNPRVIAQLQGAWVLMGEAQFLPGYCLVVPDPVVPDLNSMPADARELLLRQVGLVGDALLAETDAVRINYEILGNLQPALHVHLFPRYDSEAEELRTKPVWFYDWENCQQFESGKNQEFIAKIRQHLEGEGICV